MKKQKYKEATINYEAGIHARPASQIAEIAKKAKSPVYIRKSDEIVNAAETLDILTLFCPKGTKVEIFADNPQDEIIVDEIIELIKNN